MNRNRDIALARYLAGEMSMKEEIAFRKELESDPRDLNDLLIMEQTWKHFDQNSRPNGADSDRAWSALQNRLEKDGLLEESPSPGSRFRLPAAMKIAATILLVLAIGIPALYFGFLSNREGSRELIQIAEKGVRTVDLPDGSRVFLNEGARITYPASADKGRNVQLSGEAYFEVMSDPMNPFTVRSGKVVVSVLGTSFNMKPSGREEEVEVFVNTGKVRMSLDHSSHFITLGPGEVGKSSRKELSKQILEDPNYLSWKTKEFKFVEANLKDVLLELEESYHVQIHTGNVELQGMKITTSYSEQSIDAILETIGTAFGLKVSLRKDGYYLSN